MTTLALAQARLDAAQLVFNNVQAEWDTARIDVDNTRNEWFNASTVLYFISIALDDSKTALATASAELDKAKMEVHDVDNCEVRSFRSAGRVD